MARPRSKNNRILPEHLYFDARRGTYRIKENDRVYVAMRDVCSGLGIDWEGQRQRIMRHDVLSTCAFTIQAQISGDDQPRNIITLPIEYLQGWLFTIKTRLVKPEIRPQLIEFQRECFQVLHDYWV